MIEYFTTALSLARHALGLVKDAKDVLPDSKKPAVEAAIQQADQAFKIAEAQAAEELGYHICKCTWPPQIALRDPSGAHRCPKCGRDVTEDFRPITHPHFRQS
jgi:hypothetical protein